MVPKVGLDGFAFWRKAVVEDDGIGDDVVARREMAIIRQGTVPKDEGICFGIVYLNDNHAIADGYLVANVFRLLEQEIKAFVDL